LRLTWIGVTCSAQESNNVLHFCACYSIGRRGGSQAAVWGDLSSKFNQATVKTPT
jgi:hypothetical protein